MIESKGTAAAVVIVALSTLFATLPAGAESPAPPKGSPEQVRTITDIRSVGTAMFVWYKDQLKARPKHEGSKHEEANATTAAFGNLPVISREDLAKLLVPKYIAEIPEQDGWGHPYEFRLNTRDLDAQSIMALRSAGRDGKFSGDSYEISAFAPADQDQDVAWMDGYFVHWPQREH